MKKMHSLEMSKNKINKNDVDREATFMKQSKLENRCQVGECFKIKIQFRGQR